MYRLLEFVYSCYQEGRQRTGWLQVIVEEGVLACGVYPELGDDHEVSDGVVTGQGKLERIGIAILVISSNCTDSAFTFCEILSPETECKRI